jgi:hypothetical protein
MQGLIVLRVYLILFYGLAFQELAGDLYIVAIVSYRIPGIGNRIL